MAEPPTHNPSLSTEVLACLVENYLQAPTPELASSLQETLAQWQYSHRTTVPPDIMEKALEQSPVAVSITDLKANILYTNRCFSEVTGYSAEEIRGQNESVLSYKTTPATVYRDLWESLLRGVSWSGVLVNRRKDGSRYLAELTITPVLNVDGEPTHYLGIHRDMTEMFELEQRVSNQKALIESVVDANPAAMAVLDSELKPILDNQAYKKLVGDMRGVEPAHAMLDGIAKADPAFRGSMQQQQSFQGVEVMCDPRGHNESRWFSCSGIWFKEKAYSADAFYTGEKSDYLLLVAHEITVQKHQQEAIRRNAMRALLAEDAMIQGMRETLSAALYQLEGPFNLLHAALDMLQRRGGESALDASLLSVLSEVRDAGAATLENLRQAIPRGLDTESVSINLNQIVLDVLQISTERLLSAGIVIDWQPQSILPPMRGLENSLRNMLKQILDNAIEAVNENASGEREIVVSTRHDDGWVILSATDTGPGIPESMRLKVFEPFFSTKNPTRVHHAGMGLTLAQEVINQHAGTIDIEQNTPTGCRIQIRFPVERG